MESSSSLPERTFEAAEIFLRATDPVVEDLRTVGWDVGDALLPMLARTVVCRQHDYLGAATALGRSRRGWAIVPLLRPACEELIWISMLAEIDEVRRERILMALARLDSAQDIRAQDRFFGRASMVELGYAAAFLVHVGKVRPELKRTLNTEFRALGFALRRSQTMPSVAALAERTGRRRLYEFIYHATSTAVHFKPGQLMRGVWGWPGEMRGDLGPIEARMADFGVYWGLRLVLDTLLVALPVIASDDAAEETHGRVDVEAVMQAAHMLDDGQRPFVLPDELTWPSQPG